MDTRLVSQAGAEEAFQGMRGCSGKAEWGFGKQGQAKDAAGAALGEQVILGSRSGVCKSRMHGGQPEAEAEEQNLEGSQSQAQDLPPTGSKHHWCMAKG